MNDINAEIKELLVRYSEEDYKKFSSKLLPESEVICGVRIPTLRNIAKDIAEGDWKSYLSHACDDTFEEVMLQGLTIGYVKAEPSEIIDALKNFIPKIKNWSVCDSSVMGLKAVKKHPDIFWEFIQPYLNDENEYFVRFALVFILAYYVNEKYLKKIFNILDAFSNDGYYAKTAAAWTVSVCYVKFPNETYEYLLNSHLDEFTYSKSIQKIIESYRVNSENKKMLRELKR
ncbi:MAG TPA: DNA alkylation repair protein [Methanocorpusculum sp.]|nr:DNA alkylation repair protein [Methanocorpusculum sp.]